MWVPIFSFLACLEVARLVRLSKLATGWFFETDIFNCFLSQNVKAYERSNYMENSPNRFPFWYLVSQKFHNFLVIIHLWRLLRQVIERIFFDKMFLGVGIKRIGVIRKRIGIGIFMIHIRFLLTGTEYFKMVFLFVLTESEYFILVFLLKENEFNI